MKLIYMFNHHYGLMDNLTGMFTTYLLCKLKNYDFMYNTSCLRHEINFDKYLINNYLNKDKNIVNNKVSYVCIHTTNSFLQDLYYNTPSHELLYISTNLWVTQTFDNILEPNFIKQFIHDEAHNLLNLSLNKLNLNMNYIVIHYRFGDIHINNTNQNTLTYNIDLALKRSLKILNDNNYNKILLLGDNRNIIKNIINDLPEIIKQKIIFDEGTPKHFHDISTENELDFLINDVNNILNSQKIFFCGLGPGSGFAFLLSLIGNIYYEKI